MQLNECIKSVLYAYSKLHIADVNEYSVLCFQSSLGFGRNLTVGLDCNLLLMINTVYLVDE